MNSYKLIARLGCSIKSPNISTEMLDLDINSDLATEIDTSGNVYRARASNRQEDFAIGFWSYARYLINYGQPNYVKEKIPEELILTDIHYNLNYKHNQEQLNVKMPFDLVLGDSTDDVGFKLNKKPKEKSKCPWGYAWYYYDSEYYIIARFSDEYKLLGMSIYMFEISEKRKIELSKSIDNQKKNIYPENAKKILEHSNELPTLNWTSRKSLGDDLFTEENIRSVEVLLQDYLTKLHSYTLEKKNRNIYNSVKKIVLDINRLNQKYGGFIETTEREELCDFIHSAVRKTGFELDESIDLTEQWRNW